MRFAPGLAPVGTKDEDKADRGNRGRDQKGEVRARVEKTMSRPATMADGYRYQPLRRDKTFHDLVEQRKP